MSRHPDIPVDLAIVRSQGQRSDRGRYGGHVELRLARQGRHRVRPVGMRREEQRAADAQKAEPQSCAPPMEGTLRRNEPGQRGGLEAIVPFAEGLLAEELFGLRVAATFDRDERSGGGEVGKSEGELPDGLVSVLRIFFEATLDDGCKLARNRQAERLEGRGLALEYLCAELRH